ncbi:MAG: hypothetical protein Q4C60_08370 [Eubacteriales bacterium]|nr:hypothetical protein [Eubacteriales bacterium]
MINDAKTFCRLFYSSTFLPISYCHYETSDIIAFPFCMDHFSPRFLTFQKNPDYFVSDSHGYYGFVESPEHDYCLILGPVFSTSVTEDIIHTFMREWAIGSEYRVKIAQFLQTIPSLTFQQFLNTLSYLYFCLNDKPISLTEHFRPADESSSRKMKPEL